VLLSSTSTKVKAGDVGPLVVLIKVKVVAKAVFRTYSVQQKWWCAGQANVHPRSGIFKTLPSRDAFASGG
jgi:hypothetical protein